MSSPEALLSACTTNHEAQLRLTESASGTLSLWENWLKPVRPGRKRVTIRPVTTISS